MLSLLAQSGSLCMAAVIWFHVDLGVIGSACADVCRSAPTMLVSPLLVGFWCSEVRLIDVVAFA